MKIDVLNINGSSAGKSVDLPEDIFGIEPNEHAVYLAVKSYNAAQRQGTHKAKEKGEVKASTRKIKKQKGTGTARAGSLKSPLFRGGGRVFGPRPRKYTVRLNKKVKSLAKASALSYKVSNDTLKVVENFTFDAPKTKDFLNVLNAFSANDKKTLFVLSDYDKNVLLSSRNLPKTKVIAVKDLNTYDVLNASEVYMSEGAIDKIKELFA